MIRNQKIKVTFNLDHYFLNELGVFQSFLDCFSIEAFTQNIKFLSSVDFPFVTIFKCCNL